ncbi:4'-phosphopantetheinyl transferase superfamily protein [Lacinutrix sp. Hel_I_90]|uniref:4'-phosphopantetheinyl transferase family protein n=1 Tax=Lacinutrix sp. Hel_I_90 TaxID=1249999 RepID=UPI0006975422|nr:4'-phosphopantetheinyl transferase superfamily protein [Lacinutrix sp. Hel_I_90]
MIGNDIIDLKQAAKDSPDSYRDGKRYQRFLDKVFTKKEQQLISNSKDQYQVVWLLWSMKEAAYKVNVQQFGKRFFNPKRLECELFYNNKGQVTIDGNLYFTLSMATEEFIHSIATLEPEHYFKSAWFKVESLDYKTQSKTLKKKLLESLNIDFLELRKDSLGVPILFLESQELDISISFSHHGSFSSYSIL